LIHSLTQLAAADTQSGSVFTVLGIDWQMLVLQIIAFLLLVAILGKWVYPWLMKSVDERQENIDAAVNAAAEAQKSASDGEARIQALLDEARAEAADIVATAKDESTAAISAAELKAKKRAEQIVMDAKDDIAKEIVTAKKALHDETLQLVALATGKVVGKVMDSKLDDSIIRETVKDAKI
jgi:F-type H+-transporting ATPase subunit b